MAVTYVTAGPIRLGRERTKTSTLPSVLMNGIGHR